MTSDSSISGKICMFNATSSLKGDGRIYANFIVFFSETTKSMKVFNIIICEVSNKYIKHNQNISIEEVKKLSLL